MQSWGWPSGQNEQAEGVGGGREIGASPQGQCGWGVVVLSGWEGEAWAVGSSLTLLACAAMVGRLGFLSLNSSAAATSLRVRGEDVGKAAHVASLSPSLREMSPGCVIFPRCPAGV